MNRESDQLEDFRDQNVAGARYLSVQGKSDIHYRDLIIVTGLERSRGSHICIYIYKTVITQLQQHVGDIARTIKDAPMHVNEMGTDATIAAGASS